MFAVSKLLLDLYEFGLTIGDAILPLFKDLLDRAKGKSLEDIQHQGKINYLCDEQRCFPAESPADLFCGVSEASGFCEKCEHVTWWLCSWEKESGKRSALPAGSAVKTLKRRRPRG